METYERLQKLYNFDPYYLYPPEESSNIVHNSEYIFHGKKEKGVRKIYNNVEFTPFELE